MTRSPPKRLLSKRRLLQHPISSYVLCNTELCAWQPFYKYTECSIVTISYRPQMGKLCSSAIFLFPFLFSFNNCFCLYFLYIQLTSCRSMSRFKVSHHALLLLLLYYWVTIRPFLQDAALPGFLHCLKYPGLHCAGRSLCDIQDSYREQSRRLLMLTNCSRAYLSGVFFISA